MEHRITVGERTAMKNELMVLAGEIAKKDPAFEQHVTDQFRDALDEIGRALDQRDMGKA